MQHVGTVDTDNVAASHRSGTGVESSAAACGAERHSMDDQLDLGLHMNRLTIALIASAFAATAAAQTGIVTTATVGDHGSPAMHAAETARNVQASKAVIGLSDTAARQQAVTEATRVADHGTPVIHAEDAWKNVAASSGQPRQLGNDATAQEAARQAVEGQKK